MPRRDHPNDLLRRTVRDTVLATSRTIQTGPFLRSTDADLRLLFDAYDCVFFAGRLAAAVARETREPLTLEWSGRLRSSGGVTHRTVRRGPGGPVVRYRIAVSRPLLMDNFRAGEPATVCGVACPDRLDGLMRIMEHELLHLHEFTTIGRSDCAARPFQTLAARHFGHAAHQHRLTTPRQRVLAQSPWRPGMTAAFVHEGRTLVGRINRVHTRATLLVEHPRGVRYTDGRRYQKFYVPVTRLSAAPDVLRGTIQ